jgi:hypothetical protein
MGPTCHNEDAVPALEDEISAFWRQARISARDAARAVAAATSSRGVVDLAVTG